MGRTTGLKKKLVSLGVAVDVLCIVVTAILDV